MARYNVVNRVDAFHPEGRPVVIVNGVEYEVKGRIDPATGQKVYGVLYDGRAEHVVTRFDQGGPEGREIISLPDDQGIRESKSAFETIERCRIQNEKNNSGLDHLA